MNKVNARVCCRRAGNSKMRMTAISKEAQEVRSASWISSDAWANRGLVDDSVSHVKSVRIGISMPV
jgi:hypothetical protein